LGGFTLIWLNISPFYVAKENAQIAALKLLWQRAGSTMQTFNDMLPKSVTSTSIDKDTYALWQSRNCSETGLSLPEEDSAPPLLPQRSSNINIKKRYI